MTEYEARECPSCTESHSPTKDLQCPSCGHQYGAYLSLQTNAHGCGAAYTIVITDQPVVPPRFDRHAAEA